MKSRKSLRKTVLLLSGLVLAAAVVLLPLSSGAEDKTWVGGSGWWDEAANWDPPGQPREDDGVEINNSGANNMFVYYRNLYYPDEELFGLNLQSAGGGNLSFVMALGNPLRTFETWLGYQGPVFFYQASGSHVVSDVLSLSGASTYVLTGGHVEAWGEWIGLSGLTDGTSHFIQMSGKNTVEELLWVGKETTGIYELHGGELSSRNLWLGEFGRATFIQTGGSNRVTETLALYTWVGNYASYELQDGDLEAGEIIISTRNTFTQTGGGNTVFGDLKVGTEYSGTYNLSGGDLLSENLFVAHSDEGIFNQTGGTNTVNYTLYLGYEARSSGTYNLSDGILSSRSINVGESGSGHFTQTGGTIYLSSELVVGKGGSGSYDMTGGNLWTGYEHIGDRGPGAFTQSGGKNSIAADLYVGISSPGSYTLSGDGILEARDEYIGFANTGTFTQTGGTNQITNELWVGGPDFEGPSPPPPGEGTYFMSGGTLSAKDIYVGSDGAGNFFQEGGSTSLRGSLFLSRYSGTGSYTLSGGDLEAANEYVGYAGAGSFNHTRGRNTISDYLYVGYNEGSQGSYSLGGEGILAAQNEVIGRQGEGSFIQDGGSNRTDNLVVGSARGGRGSYLLSGTGSVRALEETIGLFGTGSFTQTGGENRVTNALRLAVNRTATGEYLLEGGTLRSGSLEVGRRGVFTQTGGTFQTGALSNVGEVNLEGGKTKVTGEVTNASTGTLNISHNMRFPGDVTNEGTIKTTGATVTWGGHFTNLGAYISDPSKQTFQDLVVGETGYLVGFSQDTFVVRGDFENRSTQNQLWQTDQAVLRFRTVLGEGDTEQINIHNFWLAGADLGPGGGANNFRWGTLMVDGIMVNLLDGNPQNQGSALYVGKIQGLEIEEGVIMNIFGLAGLNLYYDPYLNPELGGLTYSLYGINNQLAGSLMPTPVPASVLLLGSGLVGLGLLGWRRKRKI